MIGTTLSHFRLTEKLGAGGMGEVYRGEDTRLGRSVAVKVLPEAFVAEPERLARFEREARLLASLNHPNIAGLHDVGEDHGTHFLVMELAPGETLAARLARGRLPLDDALAVAAQVAEAVAAAHDHGIVHRDLKPGNVMVTADGAVKVLDFGLARAIAPEPLSRPGPDLSQSPTLAHTGTLAGVLLGTAAYMSPEQARGRTVDRRTDVWAFGCVLFEMLAGRSAFGGETVAETLAAVLRGEPDWSALPAGTPPGLVSVLRRCLEKDPRRRLHDVSDARLLLEEARAERPGPAAPTGRAPRGREAIAWGLAAASLAAALPLGWRASRPAPVPALTRFSIELAGSHSLDLADVPILALSPDGGTLAFSAIDAGSGQAMIYVRPFAEAQARPLAGTEGGTSPFFSPDGMAIAFFAEGRLKRVPSAGGPTVAIADTSSSRGFIADTSSSRGGVWSPDGSILYSPEYTSGLWRVPAAGGAPEQVVALDAEKGDRTYRWPDVVDGGRAVLYTAGSLDSPNNYDDARIEAYSFASGKRRVLVEGANMARFAPPDRLVYCLRGILYAVAFDPATLAVSGEPAPVLEGVAGDPSSGACYFAIAGDGTLAFAPGVAGQREASLTLLDREGKASRLPLSPRGFFQPRFSPDGKRLAFTVGSGTGGGDGDVWVYSLDSGSLSRLTFGGRSSYPAWKPDGREISYCDLREEVVMTKPADGSGAARRETSAPSTLPPLPESWSPDGRTLAFVRLGPSTGIYLMREGEEARLFEKDAAGPTFSPDGRFVAYFSPSSGLPSVFVRPVEGEGKWQVSPGAGSYPRWSRDGHTIYYLDTGAAGRPLVAVDVTAGETFQVGPARVLFGGLDLSKYRTSTNPLVNWDAAPDGRFFAFVELDQSATAAATRIDVALHWVRHLGDRK
jgi:Tol biopolymer transport system component